jgi:hypothetical protein
MAFLWQCLQLQRLHQGLDSVGNASKPSSVVEVSEVVAESLEVNTVREKQALSEQISHLTAGKN